MAADMASADWEWPAETVQRSPYYAPSRIETKEPPAPDPQPKLLKRAPIIGPATAGEPVVAAAVEQAGGIPPAPRRVNISDYAWADDGLVIKVYLNVPGIRRQFVRCEFRDEGVDFCAEGLPDGVVRTLSLRRLYDHIHAPGCSYKVRSTGTRACGPRPRPRHAPVGPRTPFPHTP
jgi:hypothetical protein